MKNDCYPFVNLPLPYAYDALEPFIDGRTMHLHHDRHLQTYIDNLNALLQGEPQLQRLTLEQLIRRSGRLPSRLCTSVRNNAGGVYNHRFFFEGLAAPDVTEPHGELAVQLVRQYGSMDDFKMEMKKAALSVFGSGYAWLIYDRCGLKIVITHNQGSPVERGLCPILAIDVWEHAYYLKHYNVRSGYVDDWMQVISWAQAERNYIACRGDTQMPPHG